MIPPGYGLSDVALIITIANRIYHAYKDSPGEFKALSGEVEALESTLEDFKRRFCGVEHNGNGKCQPAKLVLESKELLEELDTLLKKYKSLSTDNKKLSFNKLLFGSEDTKKLRERMRTLTSDIQGLQIETILQQTDSISAQVTQICDKLVQDKHGDNTLRSTTRDQFFDEIYAGLGKKNISMKDINGNEDLIVNSIVKSVEKHMSTQLKNSPVSQPEALAIQDDRASEQLSGNTRRESESDYEDTSASSRYPWDPANLVGVGSTQVTAADEKTELRMSILQEVTKRISAGLQNVGNGSQAHDGLPPDPPSAAVRKSIALFERGAFRTTDSGPDELPSKRKASTSAVGEADPEVVTRTNTGSSPALRLTSALLPQQRSKSAFTNFLSEFGQSSPSVMEKTQETNEATSTSPLGFGGSPEELQN